MSHSLAKGVYQRTLPKGKCFVNSGGFVNGEEEKIYIDSDRYNVNCIKLEESVMAQIPKPGISAS